MQKMAYNGTAYSSGHGKLTDKWDNKNMNIYFTTNVLIKTFGVFCECIFFRMVENAIRYNIIKAFFVNLKR